MNLRDVEAKADEIVAKLSVYDFTPTRWVHVRTDEGFRADIPSAFILKHGDWYIVFAEHHKPVCFPEGDIEELFQYELNVLVQFPFDDNQIKDADKYRPKRKKT